MGGFLLLDAQPARRRRLRFEGEGQLEGEVKVKEEGSKGRPAEEEQQDQQTAHGAGQVCVEGIQSNLGNGTLVIR